METNIFKKLIDVQSRLKAPKGNYNKFGKYKYRSCEDILEAVKPLLKENGLTMQITDEVVQVGERYYVKATVTVTDEEGQVMESKALAREDDMITGMAKAQITGAASSYARKYALNGMFLIDDTKDFDTDEVSKGQSELNMTLSKIADAKSIEELNALYKAYKGDKADILSALGERKKQLTA